MSKKKLKTIFGVSNKSAKQAAKESSDFQALRTGFFERLMRDSSSNCKFNPKQFSNIYNNLKQKNKSLLKELFDEGRSTKFIHDYMTEEWLPNHLYYWCQVKITKEEHKKDNLERDEHTLDEKENLIHYNEAIIELLI